MSVFQQIAGINFSGSLQFTIEKSGPEMVVFVVQKDESAGNNSASKIPPLVIRGTPEELDSGFVSAISDPIERVSGLVKNVEHYNKSVQDAEVEAAKTKASKPEPKKSARKKDVQPTPAAPPAPEEPKPVADIVPEPIPVEQQVQSTPEPIPPAKSSVLENDEIRPTTPGEYFETNNMDEEIEDDDYIIED